ncbi:hypothetical protein Tco_0872664 [Tanacetum coccineum]
MWITLMFLLMRNGTLGWYLLGFRQISKRCSKASSIVYGGRFGVLELKILFEKYTPSQARIFVNIVSNFIIGKVHWIRAKEATGWIPEFSEDEEDDDHSEQEFISSEQSDLGLHIDGEGNGASENPSLKYPPGFTPSVEKNGSKSKDDQVQNISDNQLNGDNESVHRDSLFWGTSNSFSSRDVVSVVGFFGHVRGVWIKSGMDYLIVCGYMRHMMLEINGYYGIIFLMYRTNGAGDSGMDAPGDDSNAMRNSVCTSKRYDKPRIRMLLLIMPFRFTFSTDQQKDLECMVSKEEAQSCQWDSPTEEFQFYKGLTAKKRYRLWDIHVDADRIKSVASI